MPFALISLSFLCTRLSRLRPMFYRVRPAPPISVLVRGMLACAGTAFVMGCELPEFESLAIRCQFEPCVCVTEQVSLIRRPEFSDVLWRDNGDAYCAAGYVLRTPAQLTANTVAERRRAFRETR